MANQSSSMLIESSSAIRTVDGAIQGTLTPDQIGLEDEGLDLSGFSVPDLRITVGELPGLSAPGRGQMGGAAWYLIDTGDPVELAAAWDFMKFFNQTDQQVTWAIEGSSFPVRRAAAEDPRLQTYWTDTQAGRWMAEAYKGFTTLDPDFPGPVIGPYKEFREAVRNGLDRVIFGDAEPRDAMEEIDARFQEQLDDYARDVGA
jgi:sn-glycerol 3-phosphate transport system substrate-binding protein